MKKILVIHTNYRDVGGEDIAVINEVELLKKFYEVQTLYFSNNISNYLRQAISFIFNRDKRSIELLKKELKEFNPDIVYVHNTWFRASLGIFKLLANHNVKIILKLHNFRYDCTKSLLSSRHFKDNQNCRACGQNRNSVGFLNLYYEGDIFKSVAMLRYGKKYIDIIRNSKIKILVLTNFHLNNLKQLGLEENRLGLFPNYLKHIETKENNEPQDYILYAGRLSKEKGVEELIKSYLSSDLENISLKIIGNGPMYSELIEKYSKMNVEFLGQISNSEVIKIMVNSKAVVTATKLFEGQPTLLCEASMLGVPSIFPQTGGISDFFPPGYPLSFEQFNYEDLKEKLKLLTKDDYIYLEGKKNKEFIEQYLNEKKLINKFNQIINDT